MKKLSRIIIQILIIIMCFLCVQKSEYAITNTTNVGDINGDGKVDILDTIKILEHNAAYTIPKIRQKNPNWILNGEKLVRADIDGNNIVDQNDVLRTLEYIAATGEPKILHKHPEWKRYIEDKWTKTEVTGLTLDKTSIVIEKGQKITIKATPVPTNATNKIITWSSSDTKVATVDGFGNVTGISKGITIITAKATNNVYTTAKVEVRDNYTTTARTTSTQVSTPTSTTKKTATATTPTSTSKATYNTSYLNFRDATFTYDGKAHSITATGVPTGVSVTYIGNNKINAGQYTVTAQFNVNTNYNPIPNKTAKLTINKRNIASTSISAIDKKAYTGRAITPNVTIKYGSIVLKNGTDYTVQYKDNVKVGNAKAVITGKGNYTGTITKTFSIVTVKTTKIVTSGQTYRLVEKGKTAQLTAKVSPDNSTYKAITWTSSNPKVVTVNSTGTIRVIAHGTAKITATQKESKVSATYTIVGYTPPKSISLNKTSTTIYKGAKETLTATFNPTTTSSNEITWTSSNPNVVSVDSQKTTNKKVTITAKSAGTATITATHKYGKKATCKVTVINKPLTTVLNGHKVTLANGNDRVYFLDVIGKYDEGKQWQGSDAIVLESNGKYAMIDTGVAPTRGIVVKYLNNIGAKQLEFMLITHAHYDHIAGGVAILNNGIKVKKLYIKDISSGKSDKDFKDRANELIKLARKKGTQICNVASGKYKTEVLGDFKFNFYNTNNLATKAGFDENLNSIATLATINGKKIYFTGDLTETNSLKIETNVAKAVGKIDFYKVAHHSYDWSNKTSALKILNPTYGVVTNAKDRKETYQARKRILNNTNINESRLWYVASGTVILTIQQNGVFKIQQLSPDN